MLGKAPGLGADMVFLDLEDSVAPLEKEAARANVVRAINDGEVWHEPLELVIGQERQQAIAFQRGIGSHSGTF